MRHAEMLRKTNPVYGRHVRRNDEETVSHEAHRQIMAEQPKAVVKVDDMTIELVFSHTNDPMVQ